LVIYKQSNILIQQLSGDGDQLVPGAP
jgi:hypothetical protein